MADAIGAAPAPDPGPTRTKLKPASRYLMTKRGYLHPQKTYVWITLLIIGVMSLLYFVLGLSPDAQGTIPPAFSFGASDLYFHSIAIGFAALGVYLVFMAFDLDKYEPPIDFPLSYRALAANVIAAIGAFFYLRPVFNQQLAPIPLGLILLGLILLADVGGALLVELYLLPAKMEGTYDSEANRMGMIPRWSSLPSWKQFRKMDSAYWLTFVTVIGAFIAGITGFVAFWMNYFVIDIGQSPGLLSGYVNWLGGPSAVLGSAMGSHSHAIVMCLLLGIVAVTVQRFEVLHYTGWKRTVSVLGLWVAITGVIALSIMFFLETYTTVFPNGVPPALFASDPGGSIQFYSYTAANGMASDYTTMLWAAIGAMIVLVPLFFTRARGTPTLARPRAGVDPGHVDLHLHRDSDRGVLHRVQRVGPSRCSAGPHVRGPTGLRPHRDPRHLHGPSRRGLLRGPAGYADSNRRVRDPVGPARAGGGYDYAFLNWQQGSWAVLDVQRRFRADGALHPRGDGRRDPRSSREILGR